VFLIFKLDQFSRPEASLAHELQMTKMREELLAAQKRVADLEMTSVKVGPHWSASIWRVEAGNERGRPSTGGRQQGIVLRLDPPNLSALDAWIAAQPEPRPSRSEAIRLILSQALGKTADAKSPALPPASDAFLRALGHG
jgi:hypothetical protein